MLRIVLLMFHSPHRSSQYGRIQVELFRFRHHDSDSLRWIFRNWYVNIITGAAEQKLSKASKRAVRGHCLISVSFIGSLGKTTFLNDVRDIHKCTYIRQYHNMRPYITVRKIPNFDPTKLPYWKIYENEDIAESIKVGGTMARVFTAGLSGGQRKLLLFELISQRIANQSELLVVLDEPFAGVTDDVSSKNLNPFASL